ncbi:hypothetical protein MMA231_04164 (plasmid) [Asticcacaulis sp. MM231]
MDHARAPRLTIMALSARPVTCGFGRAGPKTDTCPPETHPLASAGVDASSAGLQLCQVRREPEEACRRLWADNHRRFLNPSSYSG